MTTVYDEVMAPLWDQYLGDPVSREDPVMLLENMSREDFLIAVSAAVEKLLAPATIVTPNTRTKLVVVG